jgi:hypothetical protein
VVAPQRRRGITLRLPEGLGAGLDAHTGDGSIRLMGL